MNTSTEGLASGQATGDQAVTQNPQNSTTTSGLSAQPNNLQPVSASSLLTSSGGIELHNTNVATVSLSSSVASAGLLDTKQSQHHSVNVALVIILVIVVAAAIGFFVNTTRTAKSTTN